MGILSRILIGALKPTINKMKGNIGEKAVIKEIKSASYQTIWNLMLVDENGHSHQIDAVAVGPAGIFAIEVKNYAGRIIGSPAYKEWIQYLAGSKHRFLSPLSQNASHCRFLESKIGYHVHSLVVFVNENAPSGMDNVINLSALRAYLDGFQADGPELEEGEVAVILNEIASYHHPEISNRDHVKEIRQTGKKLRKGICPRCGTPMVRRQGRYGAYWKCPKPECGYHITEVQMKGR